MRVILVLSFATSMLAPASSQERRVNIHQILENFIASSEANNRCGVKNKDLENGFLANLTDISLRSAVELKKEKPQLSDADLVRETHDRDKSVRAKVAEVISSKGCNFDGVQRLLKLYQFHATWRTNAIGVGGTK